MHWSRLAGFIIDCRGGDVGQAAQFWDKALGMPIVEQEGDAYVRLDATTRDLHVEVQRVVHDSRVHLDIESDDIDAEAARLERLGARRVGKVKTWWVMEAPTGHRLCVVRAKHDLRAAPGATRWDD